LDSSKIATLSVIDFDELQMLVGLSESRGLVPTQVLEQWHSSALDRYSLRNYLLDAYPGAVPHDVRPKGIKALGDAIFDDIKARLGFIAKTSEDPPGSTSDIGGAG
jgi:hypothetical protein